MHLLLAVQCEFTLKYIFSLLMKWSSNFSRNLWRPPALSEQSAIVALLARFRQQIELFKEYRAALISEAVSGKLDLREVECCAMESDVCRYS
jgi:hypothetical protein